MQNKPTIPETITVSFYDSQKKKILAPSQENEYTSRSQEGVMVINLKNESERSFLDMLLKMDGFHLSDQEREKVYKVINRNYHDDGKRIFITVNETEDE